MRNLIFIAALSLVACGGTEGANNTAVAEETSAADIGPVNDATAIDAATGQAANMAADVNYTFNEEALNEAGGNAAGGNAVANNSQ